MDGLLKLLELCNEEEMTVYRLSRRFNRATAIRYVKFLLSKGFLEVRGTRKRGDFEVKVYGTTEKGRRLLKLFGGDGLA